MQREAFETLASAVCQNQTDDERITLSLSAEASDFIRYNRAKIRQVTAVRQQHIVLSVVRGQRKVSTRLSVPDNPREAIALLLGERTNSRQMLELVPDDPHLVLSDSIQNSERTESASTLPGSAEVTARLLEASGSADLVGFYASGPMIRGFADSRGQRNWHEVASFHLDWSLFSGHPDSRDQAVKTTLAGKVFNADELRSRMEAAQTRLAMLERPAHQLSPGSYRTWLAPAAVAELLQAMAWTGFSRKEHASGTSSLGLLNRPDARLHPEMQLSEAIHSGIAPAFTDSGQRLPDNTPLITRGQLSGQLVSARSAAEFSETANAGSDEYPLALHMGGGSISDEQAAEALGTGLLIGNLWYLNYSDRQAARVTGMTRFACFWVENGRIVAPIGTMRFDDTLLNIFGRHLEGLGKTVDFLPGSSTWNERELNSVSCPGILLSELALTL